MTDEDLRSLFDAMREENAVAHTETRRHFDVGNEATRHEIRVVAESVAQVNEKLDREAAEIRDEVSSGFGETQAMIKFSYADLDRRVSLLETSFTRLERLEARVREIESHQ
jgi:hypothetical protein